MDFEQILLPNKKKQKTKKKSNTHTHNSNTCQKKKKQRKKIKYTYPLPLPENFTNNLRNPAKIQRTKEKIRSMRESGA